MKQLNGLTTTRRTMLRAGSAAGTFAALGAAGLFAAAPSSAAAITADLVDTSHCAPEVAEILRGYFAAKSRHDVPTVMSYFSRASTVYIDASLGIPLMSWEAVNETFTSIFPNLPASAISYPLRIVGDERSVAVELVDTPAFFGEEIRALSSVVFDSRRKIVRWIDFWDGRSALTRNSVTSTYPADFRDSEQNADPAVVQPAQALQSAFSAGDAAAAVALMSADVVHEDLAAHTRVRGRLQTQRYYTRALARLPYGTGAAVVHVEGGRRGGGYEWSAGPVAAPLRRGHTAIELDGDGRISRLTVIYDSSVLSYPAYQSLVGSAAETNGS